MAGQRIDFSDVNFNIGLKFPLAKMLARHDGFTKEEEEEFYDCLGEQWSEITSGKHAFTCYKEEGGVLKRREVEAGRIIPFPCVFILDCKCEQDVDGQSIFLRIKIEPVEKRGWVSPRYRYKVTELFFCDRSGDSLLGFLQMPFFIVELRYLSEDLSRASGGVSLDVGLVKRSVYSSWIKMGMPRNCKDPIILDTGLQSEGGEIVQISLQERDERDIQGLRSTQVACDYKVLIGGVVQELVQKDDDDVGENGGDEWLIGSKNDDVRLSIDGMRKWHEEHAEVSTQAADKVFEWVSKSAVCATALGDFRKQHAIPRPLSFWIAQFPEKLVFVPASKSPSGTACVGLSEKAIEDAAYWRTPLTTVGSSAMQRGTDAATAFPPGFFKKVFQTWAKTDEAQPLIREYKSSLESAPKEWVYVLGEPFWKSYVKYMADCEVTKTGSPKELLPLIGIAIKGRRCGLPGKDLQYWNSERFESDVQVSPSDFDTPSSSCGEVLSDEGTRLAGEDDFGTEVDSPKVITKEEILKVCAEVLQDGEWHDRRGLLKELNQRIPCLSASGVADSDIFDGLREFANVAFLEEQSGDWSVQLRPKAESPALLNDGYVPNLANGVRNVFCSDEEAAFLKSFIDDVLRCGYDYKPQDIVRFHTSVKSGGFTLLGGAPGSGKSTLASLYSKALGGNLAKDQDDTRYLMVDVNPSWIDPNDVLGYWNLKGNYSCASSGLVPFLRKAAKCNEVRLVCMEEMNLARVEHYFSNFIQLMSRKPEDRILLGVPFDEKAEGGKDNARLLLPMNIRFVGTNNFDETTQRFSARFYDRCNYIELQQTGHFDEFPKQIPSESLGKFNYGVSYEEYEKWWVKDAQSTLLDSNVVAKFKEIVKKLRELNLQPSPRVKLAILEYVLSRPFFEGCGSEYSSQADCQLIALDEAIAQRVLPRYSINYLRDDVAARENLGKELKDMPLSSSIFKSKCSIGERPSRV